MPDFRPGYTDVSDLGNFLHLCNEVGHRRAFYDADWRARFTMFPDTLLFTLRDSFIDCIETFSATQFLHGITYHVARVFVHDVVGILRDDREYLPSWNR